MDNLLFVRTRQCLFPQDICTTCVVARALIILGTGWFSPSILCPNCPWESEPQLKTCPHWFRAKEWDSPQATWVMVYESRPVTSSTTIWKKVGNHNANTITWVAIVYIYANNWNSTSNSVTVYLYNLKLKFSDTCVCKYILKS